MKNIVSEKEVKDAIGEDIEKEVDVNKLPDPLEIADWAIKIATRMADDDMLLLRKKDSVMHQKKLDDEFRQFSDRCYGLFDMIVNLEDPEMLILFLQQLQRVKTGEINFDQATSVFSDRLDEKHLYPKFSKKQADAMRQMKKNEVAKRNKK